jgi:hypothetical protein
MVILSFYPCLVVHIILAQQSLKLNIRIETVKRHLTEGGLCKVKKKEYKLKKK